MPPCLAAYFLKPGLHHFTHLLPQATGIKCKCPILALQAPLYSDLYLGSPLSLIALCCNSLWLKLPTEGGKLQVGPPLRFLLNVFCTLRLAKAHGTPVGCGQNHQRPSTQKQSLEEFSKDSGRASSNQLWVRGRFCCGIYKKEEGETTFNTRTVRA